MVFCLKFDSKCGFNRANLWNLYTNAIQNYTIWTILSYVSMKSMKSKLIDKRYSPSRFSFFFFLLFSSFMAFMRFNKNLQLLLLLLRFGSKPLKYLSVTLKNVPVLWSLWSNNHLIWIICNTNVWKKFDKYIPIFYDFVFRNVRFSLCIIDEFEDKFCKLKNVEDGKESKWAKKTT